MPTEEKIMNLPIRESPSLDDLATIYSNGYKNFSLPNIEMAHARDPDHIFGKVMRELQPNYKEELLSDRPNLNLTTFDLPDNVIHMTEADADKSAADAIKTQTFTPKGKLYNGLYVYDRMDIEKKTKNKSWDPIIWSRGEKYNTIMGKTIRRMEEDIYRELALPAEYLGNQFSTVAQATKAATLSMKDLKHNFQIFHDNMYENVREHFRTRQYDDPQAVPQRWQGLLRVADGPEERARALLHRMIGPEAFRSYLKRGFVTYRGASGRIYQIFPGHKEAQVWKNGEPVERLCLVFEDRQLPPTDSVIMRLLMLDHDEAEFCKLAIRHAFNPPRTRYTEPVVGTGRYAKMAERRKVQRVLVA